MKRYGMIIPDDANPLYPETAENIARELELRGDRLLIHNAQSNAEKEALYCDALIKADVAGIYAMPVQEESHALYAGLRIPVVLVGCKSSHASVSCVAMDDAKAGILLAQSLVNNGHKKLVFLIDSTSRHADRLYGFLLGAEQSGIPRNHVQVVRVAGNSLRDSYSAMKSLLSEKEPPTAIAAQDDFTAFGAWQAIVEQQLRPGRDNALIGFGDVSLASLSKYKLTSVGCGRFALETQAVTLMENMLQGRGPEIMLLAPRMFCRGTYVEQADETLNFR